MLDNDDDDDDDDSHLWPNIDLQALFHRDCVPRKCA